MKTYAHNRPLWLVRNLRFILHEKDMGSNSTPRRQDGF
jgi:hypothetical protein